MNKYKVNINIIILFLFSLIFIIIGIYSLLNKSHYICDSIISLLIIIFFYKKRKLFFLNPFNYTLINIFLLLHNLGSFKAYSLTIGPFSYDTYVHFASGIIFSIVLYNLLLHTTAKNTEKSFNLSLDFNKQNTKKIKSLSLYYSILILIIIMGFSAIHELIEFGGAIILGKGDGLLYLGAGDLDPWDTQKDLLNNFLGIITVLIFYSILNYFKKD